MRKTYLHILLISAVCIIIYSNTLNSPFIWDDNLLIVGNENIRELSNFFACSGTRYLTYLSFALNYRINDYDVAGYHIFNIAVHLLNALLLYSFIITIFKTPFLRKGLTSGRSHILALFAGLLFASHPVYTQAVTNINQRSILLATFFYLLSIISFMRARLNYNTFFSGRHLPYYVLSLTSAVLAMKCKEVSFTLPVVILLCDRYFFAGKWGFKKSIIYITPFLLTLFIIPFSTLQADVFNRDDPGMFKIKEGNILSGLNAKNMSDFPRAHYTFTEFRVFITYIRLFFLPTNLNLCYDYPIMRSFMNPDVFLSFFFLSSIFGLSVYLYYRSRLMVAGSFPDCEFRTVSFGILWFFITFSLETLVVILNFVIFEYRLYLPSIGIIIILTEFIKYILARIAGLVYGIVVLMAVVILFSIATYTRNEVYKDEITLWQDGVKKSFYKVIPHDALASAYFRKGLIKEAIEECKIVIKIKPDFAAAHSNLGAAFFQEGLLNEAIEEYKTALALKPDFALAHNNLGIAYKQKGLITEAIQEFQAALKLKPDFSQAQRNIESLMK